MVTNNNPFITLLRRLTIPALASCAFISLNTSCDSTTDDPDIQPNKPSTGSSSHYDDLDKVVIPKTLASQIKDYTGFTLSFNSSNKTPNYVAWELLGDEVKNDINRTDYFWQDPSVAGCPAYSDYTGSGYDRGHMCPAADQKWSEQAMYDCFVMANMCPQLHALNAGGWLTLENKERDWAKRDSAIMIIAGPIYSKTDTEYIGKAKVRVPSAFFKVFLAPYVKEPRAIAFVYPNMSAPGNMQNYAMSVDDLEKETGFDFFSSLPDDIEKKVEATFSFSAWDK